MMKDIQIPDNPPEGFYVRIHMNRRNRDEGEKSVSSIRVSNIKLAVRVKGKCEDC